MGERLASPVYRLITLVGPGGIGKTRRAIEVARANLDHHADGAFFCLAAVEHVENMVTAMSDALNLALKRSAESPQAQLIRYLRGKRILLLIDNLEHLMDGVELLLETYANTLTSSCWLPRDSGWTRRRRICSTCVVCPPPTREKMKWPGSFPPSIVL